MKFHFRQVDVRLWEQNINNNHYYYYEHYLANIALNLEVCFNSCGFYNNLTLASIAEVGVISLGLYSALVESDTM